MKYRMGKFADRKPVQPRPILVGMRFGAVVLATAIVAAACSSSGGANDVAADPVPTIDLPEPTATPEPTPTPVPEPTPTPTPEPTGDDDVRAAWQNLVEGAYGSQGDADHLALALANGTQAAVDYLSIFQTPSARTVDQHYTTVEATDTGWIINDCFTTTPRIGRPQWLWYSAVAVDTDDGPIIESVNFPNLEVDCIPAKLAAEVIGGYEAYLDAVPIFWEPADPEHPLLQATTTGGFFELLSERITLDREEGWVLRGRPVTHPYISGLRPSGEYILTDCYQPSQDRGVYDQTTGERLDELIAPIEEGQIDRASILMEREAGAWKVADFRRNVNVDCDFEPGADALLVVS